MRARFRAKGRVRIRFRVWQGAFQSVPSGSTPSLIYGATHKGRESVR